MRFSGVLARHIRLTGSWRQNIKVVGCVFAKPILVLFGSSEGALPYALSYMNIYLLGTVFSMVSLGMNPFITAQGFPVMGMMTIFIGVVLNIALDPLFIFTFHMNVAGAATATVISQFASCLFVLWFLGRKKLPVHLELKGWKAMSDHKRVSDILGLGMAGFIMMLSNALVQIVSNNMLSRFGGDLYISIMTIVSSVRQILETPDMGLADGVSPIMSYNYGAKKYDRVRKSIWIMTFLALGYTVVVWAAVMIFPVFFIKLFNNDPTVVEPSIRIMRLYFVAFVFQALQLCGQSVFKALNMKKQGIFFSLLRKVFIAVPLCIFLPLVMTPASDGVFIAEPVSNLIGGVICFTVMIIQVRRKLNIKEEKKERRQAEALEAI